MIGVVLRRVIVDVHAVLAFETQDIDPVLVGPGDAVKSLHNAALRKRWEV